MKCPVCGAAALIRDTRDLSHIYKGEASTIAAVTAEFCPACDESITDATETDRVMREMQRFNRQVMAMIDPLLPSACSDGSTSPATGGDS